MLTKLKQKTNTEVNTVIIKQFRLIGALILVAFLSGCGWVHQGISECPAQLRVKFLFDYNMRFKDELDSQVKNVNIWVFDSASGAPVWKASASGTALADESFEMEVPVDPGKYDFVAWCGLEGNDSFSLQTYEPASRQELEVTLKTRQVGELNVFSGKLLGLFHGMVLNYDYTPDPTKPDIRVVTVSLTKDTNDIHLILQNKDGHEMKPADFSVTITDANSNLAWNNAVLAGPVVTYQPWDINFTPAAESKAAESLATLAGEFTMSRLIAGQESWLTVIRIADGMEVLRIPFIESLLRIKDHYGDMSDQQFLDRQDEYTLKFMLDNNDRWYVAGGIYINSWVVVPPQNAGNL